MSHLPDTWETPGLVSPCVGMKRFMAAKVRLLASGLTCRLLKGILSAAAQVDFS